MSLIELGSLSYLYSLSSSALELKNSRYADISIIKKLFVSNTFRDELKYSRVLDTRKLSENIGTEIFQIIFHVLWYFSENYWKNII